MTDIYSSIQVQNFRFTPRTSPFDWRLLHGVDVDDVVSKPCSYCCELHSLRMCHHTASQCAPVAPIVCLRLSQVRLNDIAALEALIQTLQQGSTDAEPALSQHNYVQLFRLVQLAVEHLWQMRESHAKLYPAYTHAQVAAER